MWGPNVCFQILQGILKLVFKYLMGSREVFFSLCLRKLLINLIEVDEGGTL
jgi:hypothetical protein